MSTDYQRATGKRIRSFATCALGAIAVATATPAFAQDDVQNQSVLDRERPEYRSDGIRAGSFVLRPSLKTDIAHSDNILAEDTDTVSDVIFTVQPALEVRLDQPIVDLRLTTGLELERFADTSSENSDAYYADLRGLVGRGRSTQGRFRISYRNDNESRRSLDAVNSLATRLSRESLQGELQVRQDFGALDAIVNGRVRKLSYGSAQDDLGNLVDFSFRDRTIYEVIGATEYSVTANDLVTARVVYDKREQDIRPGDPGFGQAGFDLTSEGWRLEAGYGRQVSELLYLRVFVGYLEQNFDDPTLQDISGLSFNSDLFWNVTPLTSVRFRGTRAIDEVVSPDLAGNLRTEASVQVDHELKRNFVLSGRVRYADINPKGIGTSSDEFEAGITGQLFVNRLITLDGGFRHFQRNSSNAGIRFDENIFFAGIRLRI